MKETPIFKTIANCWDGFKQLPGTIEIWPTEVVFNFNDFSESHIKLSIPFNEIVQITPFMVYDIAKIGLQIESKSGKKDFFVSTDSKKICNLIQQQVKLTGDSKRV